VLVSRGWIPVDYAEAGQLAQLAEPAGLPVLGLARRSQGAPRGAVSTPVTTPQAQWYRIDIPAIQGQMPYQLEAAYLEQLPEQGRAYDAMPMRSEPMALDEGNHLSYAIQWFTFAAVLGFGYIMLVRQRTRLAAGLIKPPAAAPPMPETTESILAGDQARPVH
jgi:surfeit locus 1 family protein